MIRHDAGAWLAALAKLHGPEHAARAVRLRACGLARKEERMGAHEFHGTAPSRAGRLESKLGPGIVSADRLDALLAGRTCDCEAFGVLHRPDQCQRVQATPGPPPDHSDLEPWPEFDEGGEA